MAGFFSIAATHEINSASLTFRLTFFVAVLPTPQAAYLLIPKNEARFQRRVLACELPQGCHQGLTCQAAHNRWHIRMIAQHQGYVKVNWSRLNKDLQQAQNELARRTDGKLPRLLEEAQKFVKDNVFLATGFAGGFLLGVASS
ncbi:FUN14 domain-containing protein 1-like isoform X2 [Dermacentor albipictus]|uniref:FUN14 domain-containing protein 1-like isoform X2 n=1 Tax=Dermacentor albipictus TaxID=60249 RepID=UPI0038FC0A60